MTSQLMSIVTNMVTESDPKARGYLYMWEWREYKKIKTWEMAERLGIERNSVWRWENEQHRMSPAKIIMYADALGIDYRQLWQPPPGKPSIDAILEDTPEDLRNTAMDIVKRLIERQ